MFLTPATADITTARRWFDEFEGAGLDGVIAKRADEPYKPGARSMIKIKHRRTADCVVAGLRWYKGSDGTAVGSLLLGLYDGDGVLHHVGHTASFKDAERRKLAADLAPFNTAGVILHRAGLDDDRAYDAVRGWLDPTLKRAPGAVHAGRPPVSEELTAVVERTVRIAVDHQHPDAGTLHLLASLLDEPSLTDRLRTTLDIDIDIDAIRAQVHQSLHALSASGH